MAADLTQLGRQWKSSVTTCHDGATTIPKRRNIYFHVFLDSVSLCVYFEDKESKQCSNVKNGVAEREVLAEPDLQHFPPSQIKETTIVPLLPRKDTNVYLNTAF